VDTIAIRVHVHRARLWLDIATLIRHSTDMRRTRTNIISTIIVPLVAALVLTAPITLSGSVAEAATKRGGASAPAAARALYRAWRYHDRAAALRVATKAPVRKLFRTRASGPGWTFQGCSEKDSPDPHFDCSYSYEGGAAIMTVADSDAYGWFVTNIRFIAD
jgi:hypothetical protein